MAQEQLLLAVVVDLFVSDPALVPTINYVTSRPAFSIRSTNKGAGASEECTDTHCSGKRVAQSRSSSYRLPLQAAQSKLGPARERAGLRIKL
ncbi:hypothetical protein BDW75DRAFT_198915 [Aspergillus navahoensis]